jgi:serine/threonine protein kinase
MDELLLRARPPAFVAPEVLKGEAATRKSDVYGLGCDATCVMFLLLSGKPPNSEATPVQALDDKTHGRVPIVNPELADPEIAGMVGSAMGPKPEERPGVPEMIDVSLRRLSTFEGAVAVRRAIASLFEGGVIPGEEPLEAAQRKIADQQEETRQLQEGGAPEALEHESRERLRALERENAELEGRATALVQELENARREAAGQT